MQEVLPEGVVIRKLWIGETDKYREHVLRLDPQSRRSRFGGGVSDEFIKNYADLSTALDAIGIVTEGRQIVLGDQIHRREQRVEAVGIRDVGEP